MEFHLIRLFQRAIYLLMGASLVATPAFAGETIKDKYGYSITREFVLHQSSGDKKIEVFWAKPSGDGPWPTLFLLHGHQQRDRIGGEQFVKFGSLGRLAKKGYLAVAISQPGYGKSKGPPDFCGPYTQDAVTSVMDHFRELGLIEDGKIGLYGVSRGAIVASMVAVRHPSDVKVLISQAGAYDLAKTYPTGIKGLDRNIKKEAGISEEAFQARSAIVYADQMQASVLIVHGAKDDRFPVDQAERFAKALASGGAMVETLILPETGHRIPGKELGKFFFQFLDENLR